jgi:hypothetical protein
VIKNNLVHERSTTLALIIRVIGMETETLSKQNIIKDWVSVVSNDNLLR